MCKKCSKKLKTPKIHLEIIEDGVHYYLVGLSANRLGFVGHYVTSSAYFIREREGSLKKLIKYDDSHKKLVGEIFSNDYSITGDKKKNLTTLLP